MRLQKILKFIFLILVIFMTLPKFSAFSQDLKTEETDWKKKEDAYWQSKLDPETYKITRQGGTERPFTGKYYKNHDDGMYHCSNCGQILFSSDTKFDSGSGWPSFYDLADKGAVELKKDTSHGMTRTEVLCSRCGAHLGHLFDDGPNPTGQRYCINSASLNFEKKEEKK